MEKLQLQWNLTLKTFIFRAPNFQKVRALTLIPNNLETLGKSLIPNKNVGALIRALIFFSKNIIIFLFYFFFFN